MGALIKGGGGGVRGRQKGIKKGKRDKLVVTMFMTFHAPSLGLSCMWAIKRECRVTLDARRVQWDRMVVLSSGPLVGGVLS